jgi:protein-S-isoprenylcysteine O-methyltransferase Ste14
MQEPVNRRPTRLRVGLVYLLGIGFFLGALPVGILRLGGVLDHLLGLPVIPGGSARIAVGGLLAVHGLAWIAWTNWALVRLGCGYPQEAFRNELLPATRKLVVRGPFRYSRNPMVFGGLSALEGLCLAAGSPAGAVLVVPAAALLMAAYLRRWEEPGLVERFGAEYQRYRARVSMIIPGRPRREQNGS